MRNHFVGAWRRDMTKRSSRGVAHLAYVVRASISDGRLLGQRSGACVDFSVSGLDLVISRTTSHNTCTRSPTSFLLEFYDIYSSQLVLEE